MSYVEYTVKVFSDKAIEWSLNGQRHREDGPALITCDGTKIWYQNGKIHRDAGPAIEYTNGDAYWYQYGDLHREDGPAMDFKKLKRWYLNDVLHTEDLFKYKMATKTHRESCAGKIIEFEGKKYSLVEVK